MKKIGIDISRYKIKEATGVEVYSNHVIDGLIDLANKGKFQLILLTPKKVKLKIESENVTQKILKPRFPWSICLTLEMLFHRNEYDSIFVPSNILPFILPKKSVVTIHDVAHNYFPKAYSWKQIIIMEVSTWFAVWFATKIIAISNQTKDDLVKFYKCDPAKIETIYLGFDKKEFLEKFNYISNIHEKFHLTKQKYFVNIGRIEDKKNSKMLVESFIKSKILKDKGYKLVMIGKDGVGSEEIIEMIKGHEDYIIKTGYVDDDTKYSLLKNSAGLVFPSRFEGFGIPIVESYALNIPVICSNGGAMPEIAGDGAIVFDLQKDKLQVVLENFVNNKYDTEKLIQKANERLLFFSWKRCSEETAKLLV